KWPRNVDRSEDEVDPAHKGRPGATLVLRVDAARALDIQYNARQIIERINAYFGYRAIAELRILQAPLPAHAIAASRSVTKPAAQPQHATLPDDPLARALASMEAGVRGATRRT
ncbi:MAG: DciA family protein, partial [Hyphomicrobium sp.]